VRIIILYRVQVRVRMRLIYLRRLSGEGFGPSVEVDITCTSYGNDRYGTPDAPPPPRIHGSEKGKRKKEEKKKEKKRKKGTEYTFKSSIIRAFVTLSTTTIVKSHPHTRRKKGKRKGI